MVMERLPVAREQWGARGRAVCALVFSVAVGSAACSAEVGSGVGAQRAAIIYDGDERQELFEVADPAVRDRVASSLVALIPVSSLVPHDAVVDLAAPSRAELEGVCADERFAGQPAAAVCSGVLVDWDLVLTASHCVRAYDLDELVVAFGFHYDAPGRLALQPADLFAPVEIVADALELENGRATLDYAFVRLDRAATAPREPTPVRMSAASASAGSALISAGASEGIPVKVDRGGAIREPRSVQRDHFVADTDTAKGGSGGAAFDRELALLGVLFRGGADLVPDGACQRTQHAAGAYAQEAFTYAARAVGDLCQQQPNASSLCRSDCGELCVAQVRAPAGCAAVLRARPGGSPLLPALAVAIIVALFTRRRFRRAT